MSNMLYACSILYKTSLPFVLAFNKTDVLDAVQATTWMTDHTALMDALDADPTYVAGLSKSMALVLEEFYSCLRAVGVSAYTGAGMDALFEAVDAAVVEYHTEYKPRVQQQRQKKVQWLLRHYFFADRSPSFFKYSFHIMKWG